MDESAILGRDRYETAKKAPQMDLPNKGEPSDDYDETPVILSRPFHLVHEQEYEDELEEEKCTKRYEKDF